jgi:hypothetical protein
LIPSYFVHKARTESSQENWGNHEDWILQQGSEK